MYRTLLVLLPVLALACAKKAPEGAGAVPPPSPVAWPADDGTGVWLVAQPSDGGCSIERSDGGVVARFTIACAPWTVSRHPSAQALLLSMRGAAPVRWTPAEGPVQLPVPPGLTEEQPEPDYLGYGADGRPVVFNASFVDSTLDDDAQTAFVVFKDVRHELDYDSASMFSQVGCTAEVLSDEGWTAADGAPVVQLYEGMEPSYCSGEAGLPAVLPVEVSTQSGTVRLTDGDAPAGLEPLVSDLSAWMGLAGGDVAVGGYWFEGERFTSPLALRAADGAWTVFDFGEVGAPMTVKERDRLLSVCVNGQANVVDRSQNNAVVWQGSGGCPVFWPVLGEKSQ